MHFGNHGCYILQAKEEPDHPAQKSASMIGWGINAHCIMGNLRICEGSVNIVQYVEVFIQITFCISNSVENYSDKNFQAAELHEARL